MSHILSAEPLFIEVCFNPQLIMDIDHAVCVSYAQGRSKLREQNYEAAIEFFSELVQAR